MDVSLFVWSTWRNVRCYCPDVCPCCHKGENNLNFCSCVSVVVHAMYCWRMWNDFPSSFSWVSQWRKPIPLINVYIWPLKCASPCLCLIFAVNPSRCLYFSIYLTSLVSMYIAGLSWRRSCSCYLCARDIIENFFGVNWLAIGVVAVKLTSGLLQSFQFFFRSLFIS